MPNRTHSKSVLRAKQANLERRELSAGMPDRIAGKFRPKSGHGIENAVTV